MAKYDFKIVYNPPEEEEQPKYKMTFWEWIKKIIIGGA